jgi:predicted transcriptional regulator
MSNGDNAELNEEMIEEESLYGFPVREFDNRKTRNPNGRVVDIKRFYSRQHEIIQLDSLGYKGSEIAKMLGITPATVSNTLNSTLGITAKSDVRKTRDEEYEELRDDVMELTRKSLKVYHEIFDDRDKNVSQLLKKGTADTVVLELSGLRVPTKVDSRSVHYNATKEEIEEFKKRGMEAAKASGRIIEVESEKDVSSPTTE